MNSILLCQAWASTLDSAHGAHLSRSARGVPDAHRRTQYGQALTEMLLVGGLLVLSWHAFEYLHRMRELTLRANETARLGAFARAAGAPASRLHTWYASSSAVIQGIDSAAHPSGRPGALSAADPSVAPSSFVPAARALASDWLLLPAGLIGAQVRLPLPSVSNVVRGEGVRGAGALSASGGPVKLASTAPERRLLLAAHGGHASSLEQAQQRLTRSRSGWRAAADRSIALSRQAAGAGEPVDKPWHARKLNTDWLQPWSDLIRTPGERGRP